MSLQGPPSCPWAEMAVSREAMHFEVPRLFYVVVFLLSFLAKPGVFMKRSLLLPLCLLAFAFLLSSSPACTSPTPGIQENQGDIPSSEIGKESSTSEPTAEGSEARAEAAQENPAEAPLETLAEASPEASPELRPEPPADALPDASEGIADQIAERTTEALAEKKPEVPPEGLSCRTSGDCGRPSCKGLPAGGCEQTTPTCERGTCSLNRTTAPKGTCDTSGVCLTPKACKTSCDCLTGQSCFQSICQKASQPILCCSDPLCTQGQPCQKADGNLDLCGGSGTACATVGYCSAPQVPCTTGTQASPNYLCPATQICCARVSSNDCVAKNGQCVNQFQACPAGTADAPQTTCGGALSLKCCLPSGPTNDCTSKGGQCTNQFLPCPSGTVEAPQTTCGGSLSQKCCLPGTAGTCASVNGLCISPTQACPRPRQVDPNLKCLSSAEICCR